MKQLFLFVATLLLVTACAAPAEVTQIGPDRYAVNVGAMGIEGGEAQARNKALRAASEYCEKRGEHLNVINLDSRGPVEWGSAAGSASLEFQCTTKS